MQDARVQARLVVVYGDAIVTEVVAAKRHLLWNARVDLVELISEDPQRIVHTLESHGDFDA
jgi:predicted HAD superfamily phosphohydrolase YqeG